MIVTKVVRRQCAQFGIMLQQVPVIEMSLGLVTLFHCIAN